MCQTVFLDMLLQAHHSPFSPFWLTGIEMPLQFWVSLGGSRVKGGSARMSLGPGMTARSRVLEQRGENLHSWFRIHSCLCRR